MRSLTHSSAGSSDPVYSTSPSPLPVVHPSLPAPAIHPYPPIHSPAVIPIIPHTQPLPPNTTSFFAVNDPSLPMSTQTRNRVSRAIQSSWADSTVKRYSGTIKQFLRFCNAERVPEHLRFPANEFVLCAFAASSFGRHAGGTPRGRLSALKAWHTAHNVQWNGSTRLRYVLNGVHNAAPPTTRRSPLPPINAKMLSQLINNLDLTTPFDVAVAACAATAFWGQCRLGELLPPSLSFPSPIPLPTCNDFKRSVKNPQAYLLHLPQTKTHHHSQDVVLVDQQAPINPVSLIRTHIQLNAVPGDRHIFSFRTDQGLLPLTKAVFLHRCHAIWSALGYPRTTGHCFRIGGTTELLIAGTPPDVVKATGRWSSDSFMRYWQSLDALAPQHIRNIHTFRRRRRRRTRQPPLVG
jgi:hypothetical protein